MIGKLEKASRQRGVTLFGLLFWAVIVGFVALIGMRVLPALNEYFTIKRAVNKIATEGSTVTEIRNAFEQDNTVALEVLWTGTMAVPFGTLAVGDKMRAHFAVFIELRDGKIVAQRNYDCFEPW